MIDIMLVILFKTIITENSLEKTNEIILFLFLLKVLNISWQKNI